jgi:hypothetical protein
VTGGRSSPAARTRTQLTQLRGGRRPRWPSMSTAKTHVGRLLMKLAARDRAQLVIAAYDAGLVRPETG